MCFGFDKCLRWSCVIGLVWPWSVGKWNLSEVESVTGRNYHCRLSREKDTDAVPFLSPCFWLSGSCWRHDAVMFLSPQLPMHRTKWLRPEDSEIMVQKKLCFLLSGVFQPRYYSNGKLMSTVWRMGRRMSVVAHSCNSRTRDAKAGGLLWAQTGLGEVVNSRIAWVTDWEPVSTCPPFHNPHSKKQIPLKTKKHPKAF